jgi:hypothetical protein
MEQAIDSVEGITDEARNIVKRRVIGELTRLPERKGAVGQVDLGDLLKVRSTIRTEARKAAKSMDTPAQDRRTAYEAAEEVLTKAIESQMPGEEGAALRSLDAGYRGLKMVEHAMEMAGTRPGGFTPFEHAAGIRLGTSKGGWSRGHTDSQWELNKAWREVTQQITPLTGARGVVLRSAEMVPGVGGYINRTRGTTADIRAQAIVNANQKLLGGVGP